MYELQFPLLLDTMIANTELESDGSGTNSPGPQKKRKRGLGKGGAAAKYCTMSVAARMAQFPDEPFEERLDLLNQPMMWCLACGKPVAHQTKSFVASHLTRQCHIAGKAHIAKQKAKMEAVASTLKQHPTHASLWLSSMVILRIGWFKILLDPLLTLLKLPDTLLAPDLHRLQVHV